MVEFWSFSTFRSPFEMSGCRRMTMIQSQTLRTESQSTCSRKFLPGVLMIRSCYQDWYQETILKHKFPFLDDHTLHCAPHKALVESRETQHDSDPLWDNFLRGCVGWWLCQDGGTWCPSPPPHWENSRATILAKVWRNCENTPGQKELSWELERRQSEDPAINHIIMARGVRGEILQSHRMPTGRHRLVCIH